MKKRILLLVVGIVLVMFFIEGVLGQTPCGEGLITETCLCGSEDYIAGYCCNDVWFDPYYQEISGGCPSGGFYYVDQIHASASDSNPGTEALPWQTIEHAASVLTAGDVVLVKPGVYRVVPTELRYAPSINPSNSGTPGSPIIFKSDGDVTITSAPSALGTAQGGSVNTIILDAGASSEDQYYTGWYVRIVAGTGAGQYRKILADFYDFSVPSYFGGTKEAVVIYPWDIIPDSTSQYALTLTGPLVGTLSRNYIAWDGFKINEYDSYHSDTGSVVIWASDNVYFINNDITAQTVDLYDNHNGIRVEGSNNFVIRNNKIHGVFYRFRLGNNPQNHAGIMIYTSNNGIIEHNEIYDSYTGIFPKGGYGGHQIRYNYIHDSYKCTRISHHDNLDVYQNIFENCMIMAFQPAEGNSDIRFFNNVFYNSASGINNWFSASGINLWNNVFLDVLRPMSFEGGSGTFYSDYNDYYNYESFRVDNRDIGGLSEWQALGFDANSLEVNPLFVDTSNLDFHLQGGSPILSAGIDNQDYDNDGNTNEQIPMGIYITGDELIGLINTSSYQEPQPSICGDIVCEGGETCTDCPGDCLQAGEQCCSGVAYNPAAQVCCSGAVYTGDCCDVGNCQTGEQCINRQCQSGASVCPDGTCNGTENCYICPGDCGQCCPNTQCEPSYGEDCETCPQDCTFNPSIEVCCSGAVYTGNCCVDANCTSPETCINHVCTPQAGTVVSVDSTYPGYSTDVIDDEVIDPYGGISTTWASGESFTDPHWVAIGFSQPWEISNVTIYWAYNFVMEAFMSSQEVWIQYWNGIDYENASTITNTGYVEASSTSFDPVTTAGLRLFQPPDSGPIGYSNILWLTEIDYSSSTHRADTNGDGCIDLQELLAFIDRWKVSSRDVPMPELMEAIGLWKFGTGC